MVLLRRYSHVKDVREGSDVDALVVGVRRLTSHRAYRRDQVTSQLLKRYLPAEAGYGIAFDERALRRRLEQANLDGRTIAHLTTMCDDQLDILRRGAD